MSTAGASACQVTPMRTANLNMVKPCLQDALQPLCNAVLLQQQQRAVPSAMGPYMETSCSTIER